MSPTERTVLVALSAAGEGFYWPFDPICRHSGFERRVVRRACRSLARKGFTEYGRGLWTEDGDIAGSGYRITKAGIAAVTGGPT